jgi:hypothetical protein
MKQILNRHSTNRNFNARNPKSEKTLTEFYTYLRMRTDVMPLGETREQAIVAAFSIIPGLTLGRPDSGAWRLACEAMKEDQERSDVDAERLVDAFRP